MKIQQNEQKLFLKYGHETFAVNMKDIIFIEYVQRKSIIHTHKRAYEVSEPLLVIGNKLNDRFFRSHRSFIINVDWVEKIVSLKAKSYSIAFQNIDKEAALSRNRKSELLRQLKLS